MKHSKIILLIFSFVSLIFYSTIYAGSIPEVNGQPVQTLSGMLTKVMPAVVNVTTMGEISQPQRQENAPPATKQFQEMGSGVIVNASKGYIITNAHVIKNAKIITVMLSDGRRFKAKLIGVDNLSDLAVIQINAKELIEMPIGNSDLLQVGDFVAAIGNPFGLHQTVTSGVVSALHRSDLGIEGYESFIQTDASINPGNSGGALVNLKGELVGINTALIGPVSGNVGIGLSIPSNMASQVAAQLIKYGKVNRGVLGVMVQNLTPELADALGLAGKKGALVTNVVKGSPADKAGLKAQDVIERINDVKIESGTQVKNVVGLLPIRTEVSLYIHRKNQPMTLKAQIMDPESMRKATEPALVSVFDGVRLTNYDELVPQFGKVKGVGVLNVDEVSDAWISGLRPGDVILEANSTPVGNLDQLMESVKDKPKSLLLKVGRGVGIIFIVMHNYNS